MAEQKFDTISTSGEKGYAYSVMESWHAMIQGESDVVHIGVLGTANGIEDNFLNFVRKKEYKYAFCDFVLVTEAGELLASNIGDKWEIHVQDIHEAFQKTVDEPDKYKSVAHEFLKERFDELDDEFNRIEVSEIIQAVSKQFAELVAKNPNALKELEWRDIERMLAEVFQGIGFDVELTPSSKDGGKDIVLQCIVSGRKHSYVVEIKHWRSSTKVGSSAIKDFLSVVVKENRNSGVFLSTYGFTSNAFEAISEIERHKVKFGEKEKIVSLCKTYVDASNGILVSPDILPKVLIDGTM